jgi:hypothetical protein
VKLERMSDEDLERVEQEILDLRDEQDESPPDK